MPRRTIKLSQAPLDVQDEFKRKTSKALKHFPETQFEINDNLSISWEGDTDPEIVRKQTKLLVIREKPAKIQYFTKERREELKVSAIEACERINAKFPSAEATYTCRYDSMNGSILIKYKSNHDYYAIHSSARIGFDRYGYGPYWNFKEYK